MFIIRCLFSGTVAEKNMKPHNSNSFKDVFCSGLMMNDAIPSEWEILLQKLLKTLEQIGIPYKWQTVMKSIEFVQYTMTIFKHIIL